jgi:hypothetical protein
MSDSVKKYFENFQDAIAHSGSTKSECKYIFLLDFTDGKVYRYDISSLCNEQNKWNPDSESCEAFLYGAGHKVNDCEWMVTSTKDITPGNTL